MAYDLPPIVKLASRVRRDLELAVRAFPRYHKYAVGAELRENMREVARLCDRAWRDRTHIALWTRELVWAIDEFKLSLQLAKELRAFRSFGEFEQLARDAQELGAQAGGWKKQQQHPKGQKPAPFNASTRAQRLSTRAASAHAGANP